MKENSPFNTILQIRIILNIFASLIKYETFIIVREQPEARKQLSYYTKCYSKRSTRTTRPRRSFDSALIFDASEQNPPPPLYPWKPSTLSLAASFAPTPFHLYSPRIIDCPGHRFVHVQRAPAQARAQGNSYDYRGMIPSGLTRLLTKLFDRTNSGTPRGEHTRWLVEMLFPHPGTRDANATIKSQFGNEIANVINTLRIMAFAHSANVPGRMIKINSF